MSARIIEFHCSEEISHSAVCIVHVSLSLPYGDEQRSHHCPTDFQAIMDETQLPETVQESQPPPKSASRKSVAASSVKSGPTVASEPKSVSTTSPIASSSAIGASSGGDGLISNVMAKCWYDCGSTDSLKNIGSDRYVKLCCVPCDASRRAIDAQARNKSDPNLKASLKDLKENDQASYKALVRRARIAPVQHGVRNTGDQRQRASEISRTLDVHYRQSVMTTTKIKNSANVLWTTKSQYVQWYHINEGMPKVEAAAKWSVDSVNPDIERYMDGDELRIALQAIPTTTAGIGRGVKREIATTEDMMTMDQFKTAGARLKTESMVSIGDPMFQDTQQCLQGCGQFINEGHCCSVAPHHREERR